MDAKRRYFYGYVQAHLVAPLEMITAVAVNTLQGLGKVVMHGCSAVAHLFYGRGHIVQDMKAAAAEISTTMKFLLAGVMAAGVGILYPKIQTIFSDSNEKCKSPQELAVEAAMQEQQCKAEVARQALAKNIQKLEQEVKTAKEENIALKKSHEQEIFEAQESLQKKEEELQEEKEARARDQKENEEAIQKILVEQDQRLEDVLAGQTDDGSGDIYSSGGEDDLPWRTSDSEGDNE